MIKTPFFSNLSREIPAMIKNADKKAIMAPDGDLSSPSAKAERLKRVRNLANLSREEFCKDVEINLATLVSWEVGRFGGLSSKGAQKVIKRVAREGVFVTLDWLLHESGIPPEVKMDYKKVGDGNNPVFPSKKNSEINIINEELKFFIQHNENSMHCIIEDELMLPYYERGDYVAGKIRLGRAIKTLIGFKCIIQLPNGETLVRNLQIGPRENSFNLLPSNLNIKTQRAVIYDVELVRAAPVIWHRKKDPIA